jgi:ring-1,2-phenylacetyl-CoA epoxidase subunit PaaC
VNRNNGYDSARAEYVLRLADNCLILAQRLCAWCGHGPTLEEDLALSNVALDYLGQARLWLSYAGELEPARRNEDELAFLRDASEFRNVLLVEQPFGDFATVQARLFLFESWYSLVLAKLGLSRDERIAGIAGKAAKEVAYHLRRSSHWMVRLGDGTDISNGKLARALQAEWPYVGELFAMDALDQDMLDRGIGCDLVAINEVWQSYLKNVLADAKLTQPDQSFSLQYGKQGTHSEHMVWLLMEMQYLQRAYPGAQW